MKLQSVLVIALFSAVLLGCTRSGGVLVTEDQAAQFERGKTTYAEVTGRLGPPTSTMSFANGTKAATYAFSQGKTRPETFIPVVELFAGGAELKMSSVTFMFNQEGVLTDYMSSTTSPNGAVGAPTPAAQPNKSP
jgi:outer membrane protein assembly factor BamE (lipoprotein component of BamABCDE complex)